MINYAYKKSSQKDESLKEWVAVEVSTKTQINAVMGCPKVPTNIKKKHLKEVCLLQKLQRHIIYLHKKKCKREGRKLPNGWINKKIAEISAMRGFTSNVSISQLAIRNQNEGQIVLQGGGHESLTVPVEPHPAELIVCNG